MLQDLLAGPLPAALRAHAGPHEPGLPLEGSRWLTAWTFEPIPLAGIVLAGGLYLLGVRRLRRDGHHWPLGQTACFVAGLVWMVLAVASALATYDTVLLSVHMAQHMILAMLAPIFLVLGRPVTLALRTLPPGGRAVLLALIHSRVAAVLTHPVVAGVIFVVNPFVLYFTGLYEQTLEKPWLHDLNHFHFVAVGALWYAALLAVDPLPRRTSYPLRVIAAFLTLPFHAWLGVAIMSMNTLIAGDWYLGMDREWGASPLSDQRTAGGLLWVSGDVIGLVVFAALFRGWVRESEREARREDRRLDRLEAAESARAGRAAASIPSAPPAHQPGRTDPPGPSDRPRLINQERPQ